MRGGTWWCFTRHARLSEAAKRFEITNLKATNATGGSDPAAVKKDTSDGFDPDDDPQGVGLDNARRPARRRRFTPKPASQMTAPGKVSARIAPSCHGAKSAGHGRPVAEGEEFRLRKSRLCSISDVFTIVSQNMPATNPGSLEHDDYVQIMAYLLQENGYPAGSTALTFASGATQFESAAPIYHGK